MGDIFGVAKISNFFGCLSFVIFFFFWWTVGAGPESMYEEKK